MAEFQKQKINYLPLPIRLDEELFVALAQRSVASESFDPDGELGGLSHYSGWAGARTKVAIGEWPIDKAAVADSTAYLPQQSPEQSLTVYMSLPIFGYQKSIASIL